VRRDLGFKVSDLRFGVGDGGDRVCVERSCEQYVASGSDV
jgi:hypothetical protein